MRHALLAVLLLAVGSSPAAAEIDVTFSCPPGTVTPGTHVDVQPTPITLPGIVECAVYIGNTSGAIVSELVIEITYPSTTITLVDSALLANGVPGWATMSNGAGGFDATIGLLDSLATPTGFPAPAIDTANQTATWTLANVAPSSTSELRFTMDTWYAGGSLFGNFPAGSYSLSLEATVAGASVANTKIVPVVVPAARPYMSYAGPSSYRDGDRIVGGMRVGERGHLNSPGSLWPIQTNARMVVYLPWMRDGAVLNADTETFTAGDVPLVSSLDFTAETSRHSNAGYGNLSFAHETVTFDDTTKSSGFSQPWTGPATDPNDHQVLVYSPTTNTLTATWGALGVGGVLKSNDPDDYEGLGLRFDAALNPAVDGNLPIGTKIPFYACLDSDQARAALGRPPGPLDTDWCRSHTMTVAAGLATTRLMRYETYLRKEATAATPGQLVNRNDYVRNPTAFTADVELFSQLGGIDGPDERFDRLTVGIYTAAVRDAVSSVQIYFSTTPSSWGHRADLLARSVPQTSAEDWVLCIDGDINGNVECLGSDITALGYDVDDVQEIRIALGGLRPDALGYTAVSALPLRIDMYTVLTTAADSINETPPCGPESPGDKWPDADATLASIGALTTIREEFSDDASTVLVQGAATNLEVSARSKLAACVRGLPNAPTPGAFHSSNNGCGHIADTTLGHPIAFNTSIRNVGTLDNITAPFTACVELPDGFNLDSGNADPTKPALQYERPGETEAVGLRLPQDRFTHVWNATTRELCMTIPQVADPDDVANRLVGDSALHFSIRGVAVPGADRDMLTTVNQITANGYDVCGDPAMLSEGPQTAGFHLTLVPMITVEGVTDHDTVGQSAPYCQHVSVSNPAYSDAGVLVNPNAGSARESVVYTTLPEGAGGATAHFDAALPEDGDSVWLTLMAVNPESLGASGTLNPANTDANAGFVKCSDAPVPCDAAAADAVLAPSGGSAAAVSAVAVVFSEVRVTDAEPVGVAPTTETARVNQPYRSTICVVDDASPDGTVLKSQSYFRSIDSAAASTTPDDYDVLIDADCANGVAVASDDPTCDVVDDDCDGELNEDWVYGGELTTCGDGPCETNATYTCTDGEVSESCTPLTPPQGALDDECDGVDNDCDGEVDELWGYTGVVATCGDGPCEMNATYTCTDGEVSESCTPGTPPEGAADDECDGYDNDCDGEVDEHFVGQSITCGTDQCAVPGTETCIGGVIGDTCESEPSACAGEVWWSVVLNAAGDPVGAIRCYMDRTGPTARVLCDQDGNHLRVYLDAGGTCGQ